MKPGLLISTVLPLMAACSIALAEAPAASSPAASAASASVAVTSETPPAAATAPAVSPAASPAAALPAMPPGAPATMAPTSSAGSLLQTILALMFVLALLIGLAWFMKRYGPKVMGGNNKMRVISSLNLGGRERIVLVEVADQWIVVGASPGRINALATMPRQEGELTPTAAHGGIPANNFSDWLKKTIDKRNAS